LSCFIIEDLQRRGRGLKPAIELQSPPYLEARQTDSRFPRGGIFCFVLHPFPFLWCCLFIVKYRA
jgi:hypothetical protein